MFLVVPLAFKTNQRYSLTTVKLLLNDIVHANMVVEKKNLLSTKFSIINMFNLLT